MPGCASKCIPWVPQAAGVSLHNLLWDVFGGAPREVQEEGEGNGTLTFPQRPLLFQMNTVYGNIQGYKGIQVLHLM